MTHQPTLFTEPTPAGSGPVECLGLTIENDAARRVYFIEKLREKLQDPSFRQIEGFPLGSDEDILALSDPPYYTACPNPFLEDFVKHYGSPYDPTTDQYRREPFAADVSEGKNDPIYNAHSYHTKVPHKAIMRYILHYTQPGDMVFDGFCGTGMTGVAAQLCGDKQTVENLGYQVRDDGAIIGEQAQLISRLGARRAILCDLSPAATFIAYNCNIPADMITFKQEAKLILDEVEKECAWMYETWHPNYSHSQAVKGKVYYVVWSDVSACSECGYEMVYWDVAVNLETSTVLEEIPCPNCGALNQKRTLERVMETVFDRSLNHTVQRRKQVPVMISYSVGKVRHTKRPDTEDLALIAKIEDSAISYWHPSQLLMFKEDQWGDLQRDYHDGVTHTHHFYTQRNLRTLATFHHHITNKKEDRVNHLLLSWFTSTHTRLHRMNRYMPEHQRHVGPLSGTLYLSSLPVEISPLYFIPQKLNDYSAITFPNSHGCAIETKSATILNIPDGTIDYVFTDPPFGDNLPYSELNFLWEAWLKVYTHTVKEIIVSKTQYKGLSEYQTLMEQYFREVYRILKPGRWVTVEFHNSRNAIWNAIQEAILRAGFVIADVRTLDKKKGTTKQLSYIGGAVKQDLIISAYKPNGGLEERFRLEAGTEAGAWDFVRTHLRQLPTFVSKEGRGEVIVERLNFLLFDRMVAFHVQRGVTVPLSAAEFYAGLEQRFPKRDEMYFLPDQVAEYDQKRMQAKGIEQLQLFVTDESSAIQWLRLLLTQKPQTFQEIHPHFMQEIAGWQKHEKSLELADLLEQNFLRYESETPIPAQLWTSFEQDPDWQALLKGYSPDNPPTGLQREARHRWYVPDPNRAADLEKLRERELLKEFEEYRQSKQKKLKVFRLEAVRAGFKKAWQQRNEQGYRTIIEVAEKIPDAVLQEDSKLLMWYDQAITRSGG